MDYNELNGRLGALISGVPYMTANLANASALIYGVLEDVSWAGFYIREGEKLVLGPFQGKPACIEIPVGKGVCGTAAATGKTQLVPDVHAFPGHIACDPDSRSEIVVPIKDERGEVRLVLDLDSTKKARFTDRDKAGLETLAKTLEAAFDHPEATP